MKHLSLTLETMVIFVTEYILLIKTDIDRNSKIYPYPLGKI